MNIKNFEKFSSIPQPRRETFHFIEELKSPLNYYFNSDYQIPSNITQDCLKFGVEIIIDYPKSDDFPYTAFDSLRHLLKAKKITEVPNTYPITFIFDKQLTCEEYVVECTPQGSKVIASDSCGLRRGIYFLEDRISESALFSITAGKWRRKPVVKHRISRCFFGPTNRAPFYIDELANDIDYYPEEYLNKLAHEGINGLWLTVNFRDFPSTVFPNRGKEANKRLDKLKRTVEKCLRYGIKIYIFLMNQDCLAMIIFAIR